MTRPAGGPANLGVALREHRIAAGMTQRQLAERAGVSVRTVRDLEQHRISRPRPRSVQGLCTALGLSGAARTALLALLDPGDDPDEASLSINVLGPLTISRGGRAVELRSIMQSRLVGLLALHPRQVVPIEEIIDVLWSDRPPKSCRNLVQVYIGHLRRLLDQPTDPAAGENRRPPVIVLVQRGYLLDPPNAHHDLDQFVALAERADLARAAGDVGAAQNGFADALSWWRGPVLHDAGARLVDHPTAVALNRRRLAATLTLADLLAETGHQPRAIDSLRALATQEPLHEGLHARLITALAGGGDRAAALRVFADLRRRLREELGVDAGPELQTAHLRVLRESGTATPEVRRDRIHAGGPPAAGGPPQATSASDPNQRVAVPAQLPPDVATFTGRAVAIEALNAALVPGSGREGTAVVVSVITGVAGVGKTALAVHWAQLLRDRFPDGQLYIDLRGFSSLPPVRPIDALARFLHALGVPDRDVPVDEDEATALYRSLLADKRMLVLLDNAHHADQVRPLLPGSGRSLVVVTSRDRFSGLVARNGASRLTLDLLTPAEAQTLLSRVLSAEKVGADLATTAELARLCGYLPLALRVAAANLCEHPGFVAGYLTRLGAGNRLTALQVEGDEQSAVRAAFDLSYSALSADARRTFRSLGLTPGPDANADAVAALVAMARDRVDRVLAELLQAHLVRQVSADRYTMHDLLRLYAAERAVEEDPTTDREQSVQRLLDHYLYRVDAAARLLYPDKLRLPLCPARYDDAVRGFTDRAEALAWLDAERANLVATVGHTAAHGPRSVAWTLADALRGYFSLRRHLVDWQAVALAGNAAAQADGDPTGQAAARFGLFDLCYSLNDSERAREHCEAALELATRADWSRGIAAALNCLGLLLAEAGHLDRAVDHVARSLTLHERSGDLRGLASALINVGVFACWAGWLARSVDHHVRALAVNRRLGFRVGEAICLSNLAGAQYTLGRLASAEATVHQALTVIREAGARATEVRAMCTLVALFADTGRYAEALEVGQAACTLGQQTADRTAQTSALNALAAVYRGLGEHARALDLHERALHTATDTGDHLLQVESLIGLGGMHVRAGAAAAARQYALQALSIARSAGYLVHEGTAYTVLAATDLAERRPDATRHGELALAIGCATGHRIGAARARIVLGLALRQAGDAEAAAAQWRTALEIFTELGMPEVDYIAALMTGDGDAGPPPL